jgi:sorting nexin-29
MNKEKFWNLKATAIEDAMKKGNLRSAWNLIKIDYSKKVNIKKKINSIDVAKSLKIPDVIGPSYNWLEASNIQLAEMQNNLIYEDDDTAPTKEEFDLVIAKVKNNKAVGVDEIPAEMYKDENLSLYLFKLIKLIWKEKKMPDQWRLSKLIPVPKKEIGQYRGINLLVSAYKIYANIISSRVINKVETYVGNSQYGFLKGRSTRDVITAIRKIIESNQYAQTDMNMVLIDFSKAFDTINRDALKFILRFKVKLNSDMVDRIMDLLYQSKALIGDVNDRITIDIEKGVRQGCPFGPILFLTVLTCLINEAKQSNVQFDFAFADDLTCVDKDINKLLAFIEIIKTAGIKYGLVMNHNKTEWIKLIHGKFTQEAKLLGTWIGDPTTSIKHRIENARKSFYSLYDKLWLLPEVSLKTKLQVFNAIVMSTLLYGLESIAVSEVHNTLLDSFCYRCYKTILGLKAKDFPENRIPREHVWSLLRNDNPKFNLCSEILRRRRLDNFYHFKRRNSLGGLNYFDYSASDSHPTNLIKYRRLRKMLDVIEDDHYLLPDYIARVDHFNPNNTPT